VGGLPARPGAGEDGVTAQLEGLEDTDYADIGSNGA
jgi:hypothetical protein